MMWLASLLWLCVRVLFFYYFFWASHAAGDHFHSPRDFGQFFEPDTFSPPFQNSDFSYPKKMTVNLSVQC